ncbi:MAG: tRNA (adenosine(37)-N6)-dimethylallyltransferase MiaA [candidate division WOR-3 bacterium]|nr:tRNA (adenosine(37)-N6)-dimethylallyltransferase MiaA [candidate division WOR-3 bacterium]MDW8149993.1 tRNA (adenosine(37)-N6)-dimethylallyltransferase MiaA [candidate division WOR-3 bacterium]
MKIPIITGQTASGKTDLAQKIIERYLDLVVISIDSRKLYKYMDIGTAKPKFPYRNHYKMIDLIEPNEVYNVGLYFKNAQIEIKKALENNKKVLLEGGTILYLKAIIEGLSIFPEPPLDVIEYIKSKKTEELYSELLKLDKERAIEIHPNDRFRIERSLIVVLTANMPYKDACREFYKKPDFEYEVYILEIENRALYRNIENRVKNMLNEGLLDEINFLIKKYSKDAVGLKKTIDYFEFIDYFEGKISLEDAIRRTIADTKEFARRQKRFLKQVQGKRLNSDAILRNIRFST